MRGAVAASGLACWLLTAACTAPAPPASTPQAAAVPIAPLPTPTAVPAPVVVQAIPPAAVPGVVRPIASPSPAALPLSVLAGRNGSDVRVALDLLLRENAFLSASAMEAASNARLDELIGVSAPLDENSLTLAEIIGAVKDQQAAEGLLDAWRGQIGDLVSYAQGEHASAVADLERRRLAAANQLALRELSAAALDGLLQRRNQAELALADALVARDFEQVVQRMRSLADSTDDLARPLAAAVAAQALAQPEAAAPAGPATTEGADIDVRLHLASALQEHVFFTGAAIEAAADNRAVETQAFSAAANRDADDLGSQLGAVYGPDVASGVADRLRRQSAAFVSAAGGGDRRQAAVDIDRLRGELDGVLSTANRLLPPGLLTQQLRASDQPLLVAADAFAARDYNAAYARLREAARQAQKPADALALAIVDRYPGRYLVLPTPTPAD